MEADSLTRSQFPMTVSRSTLTSIIFVLFLYVAFVGLLPFLDKEELNQLSETGEGNLLRQMITPLLALMLGLLVFSRDLKPLLRLFDWPVILLFGWCALTLVWSHAPLLGARRLAVTVLAAFTVFTVVHALGPMHTLRLLGLTLLAFVLASLVSGLIVPNAAHLPGETDEALVGAWRGIFPHKNSAGFAAALCMVFGYFFWVHERRKVWLLAIATGAALLVLSRSKTSLGLILPSVLAGYLAIRLHAAGFTRPLFWSTLLMALAGASLPLVFVHEAVLEVLRNPESFTGRTAIWTSLLALSKEHLLTGVGFSNLYQVGPGTPLADHASGWVAVITQGHNGYLDVLATTGLVGLALTAYAFLWRPFDNIASYRGINPLLVGTLAAALTFVIAHNLLESSLLDRTKPCWIVALIVYASTRALTSSFQNQTKPYYERRA